MYRFALSVLAASCLFGQGSDYEQGLSLFERGNAAEAVPYLSRAAEANPRNPQMWKALGVAYASQKQYVEAEPAFRRACELDAKLPDACYFWARTLYGLDRFDASLEALGRANARSCKVRVAMGQAADGMGDAARAEHEFREALALCGPHDASAPTAFGLFLLRQGRVDEAIPALGDAVERAPASPEAQTYLGRALFEHGKTEEALPHLERAAALAPESADAQLLLGKTLVRLGRAEEAQAHFDAAARYAK